ncbi:MAG: diaminopimelate decarboxylase [Betaproteobacteria bacterium]|nr:diaminopimelate decarboxylase [Betaproteobacteria bacterium]
MNAAALPDTWFALRDGKRFADGVGLADIAARYGTPTFVYSRAALVAAFQAYDQALAGHPHQVCYAVKANSNLAVLGVFAKLGAGFDIVSGGELARVLAAGGDPGKVVFSGVGKTRAEIEQALEADIQCFNIESAAELARIHEVAEAHGAPAPVSFRVNPDVDAQTHPYISTGLKENKFGVAHADAFDLYCRAADMAYLEVTGIDCHIGSQLTDASPLLEAADRVLALVDRLNREGIELEHIDLGGGVGIVYRDETPIDLAAYCGALTRKFAGRSEMLMVEPGRSLVGNAGVLLTRVEYLKPGEGKNFAVVDAAMNDLMRPALYEAWHAVEPVAPRDAGSLDWDIVGPVCESGDFLARGRHLALAEGDLLAILSAGAYGMSMSSNYNSRPRACEVMVDGATVQVVRERETLAHLMAGERVWGG